MSLATSCPSCGTVFRVVEDQLKVSEGWVRCGHCHDVFNALEGLFDLERRDSALQSLRTVPSSLDSQAVERSQERTLDGALDSSIAEMAEPFPGIEERVNSIASPTSAFLPDFTELKSAAVPTASAPSVIVGAPSMDHWPAKPDSSPVPFQASEKPTDTTNLPSIFASLDEELTQAEAQTQAETAAVKAQETARLEAATAARDSTQLIDDSELEDDPFPATALSDQLDDHFDDLPGDVEVIEMLAPPELTAAQQPEERITGAEHAAAEIPTFVRDAQRQHWWSRPLVQALLGLGVGTSVLGLAAQWAWHDRDRLSVSCTVCQRPLAAAASGLGDQLRPPVDLDVVEVDNAALTQPPGTEGYRLTVQVRNHANHEVAAPHMELSLTDAAGVLVIRRSFSPSDFRHAQFLRALEESTWVLEFQTPLRKVSGYTVAAFYP